MKREILSIGTVFLLFTLTIVPLTYGIKLNSNNKEVKFDSYNSNRYLYPEFHNYKNFQEKKNPENNLNLKIQSSYKSSTVINSKQMVNSLNNPMDSAWPMHGHDVRHTGRSPYSTANTWDLVWRFETLGWADNSPVIDKNGIIYIGSWNLYAVYPDGTKKWEFDGGNPETCCPAIDENGIIYYGDYTGGNYFYAIYPNGTLKWKYPISGMCTSPTITEDGIIIFSDTDSQYIKALYPNGTLKWSFKTGHVVYSSPAIGLDGTIYCGSHDTYVYALYPNNGTIKWRFKTNAWVHGSPSIADDGTVYIGSDDGYLYALNPNNGNLIWKVYVGSVDGSPAIDKNGIIYLGVWQKKFHAIYPNGTIKWTFDTGEGKVWASSPALSDDNTVYFGTCDLEFTGGVEFIALYTDGTLKWRKNLNTFFTSPAIGENGSVYMASSGSEGFLNAYGVGELRASTNGPYYELINEPIQFEGLATGGISPYTYHWDFGDTHTSDEQNPTYTYTAAGNYDVVLTVTDSEQNTAIDTTYAWIQETNDPPDMPNIIGQINGNAGTSYDYTFSAIDPDGTPIYLFIDWDDGQTDEWIGPYSSGEEIIRSHTWTDKGTYTIKAKAKDPYNEEGLWGELEVIMTRNKALTNTLLMNLFNQNPILRQVLLRLSL